MGGFRAPVSLAIFQFPFRRTDAIQACSREIVAWLGMSFALVFTDEHGAGPAPLAKPYLSRAVDRPIITHGSQSGDVSVDGGVVWARADRPARMLVEASTTDSFKTIQSAVFVDAPPESDCTAKVLLEGLPPGQDIYYRIAFQDQYLRSRRRQSPTKAP